MFQLITAQAPSGHSPDGSRRTAIVSLERSVALADMPVRLHADPL